MLIADGNVIATVAVKDQAKGQEFYGQTLGLKQVDEMPGGVAYQCGDGKMFVYESPNAGSGTATVANWDVSDIASVVQELKDKGLQFERYEFPGATHEGDVHVMGGVKAAWFKDPDGNILGITQSS